MASQISNSERHGLAPFGASRKRKDRDRLDAPQVHVATKAEPAAPAQPPLQQQPVKPAGAGGNRLLAGYLAHEFLTKGTLFGKQWDHDAASRATAPVRHQQAAKEPVKQQQQKEKPAAPLEPKPEGAPTAYEEVAYLLKADGAHVAGVVNPTQLAQWLQM